jgi:hypothetical protein
MDVPATKAELTPRALVCVECREVSDERAKGWKAYIGGGFDGDEVEVGAFCPSCAELEFE